MLSEGFDAGGLHVHQDQSHNNSAIPTHNGRSGAKVLYSGREQ